MRKILHWLHVTFGHNFAGKHLVDYNQATLFQNRYPKERDPKDPDILITYVVKFCRKCRTSVRLPLHREVNIPWKGDA